MRSLATLFDRAVTVRFACIAIFSTSFLNAQKLQGTGAVVISAQLEAISVSALPSLAQSATAQFQGGVAGPFLIQTLFAIPPSLTTVRFTAYFAECASALRDIDDRQTAIPASDLHIEFNQNGVQASFPPGQNAPHANECILLHSAVACRQPDSAARYHTLGAN